MPQKPLSPKFLTLTDRVGHASGLLRRLSDGLFLAESGLQSSPFVVSNGYPGHRFFNHGGILTFCPEQSTQT